MDSTQDEGKCREIGGNDEIRHQSVAVDLHDGLEGKRFLIYRVVIQSEKWFLYYLEKECAEREVQYRENGESKHWRGIRCLFQRFDDLFDFPDDHFGGKAAHTVKMAFRTFG